MHFSGHKTPSMFDRYVIKSAERHAEQIRKRDAFMAKQLADSKRADAGRMARFPQVSAGLNNGVTRSEDYDR